MHVFEGVAPSINTIMTDLKDEQTGVWLALKNSMAWVWLV
jgi:hypothetical protein